MRGPRAYRAVPTPSFTAFHENRRPFVVVALVVGLIGLLMGPVIMTPAYRVLQPAMGGMTLTAVEMLMALGEVFPTAVASASAALGQGTLALLLVMFVLFDFVLRTLGGLAGYFWVTMYRREGRDQVPLPAATTQDR